MAETALTTAHTAALAAPPLTTAHTAALTAPPLALAYHARYISCANYSNPAPGSCIWFTPKNHSGGSSPPLFGALDGATGVVSVVDSLTDQCFESIGVYPTNIITPAIANPQQHLIYIMANATSRSLTWMDVASGKMTRIPVAPANKSEVGEDFPPTWMEMAKVKNRTCILSWRHIAQVSPPTESIYESLDCVELDGKQLPAPKLSSLLLWSNHSKVPASGVVPPPTFGGERAIDPDARILYVTSLNRSIARFDLATATFLAPLPTSSQATPSSLRCLHYDRSAHRLGAVTFNAGERTITLFAIDAKTGAVTARITSPTLPPKASPVFMSGNPADAPVCSFSQASGKLALLFSVQDAAAKYAYLVNEHVYAMVFDTRTPKWLGAPKIEAPLLGPPPHRSTSGGEWRAVGPSLSFVDS